MKLYSHPVSGCARRVLAFVGVHGCNVEIQHVALEKNEQTSPEYLSLNPNGRVPTLVDGDLVLWESPAILRYLAALSAPEMLGRSASERAHVDQWMSWGVAHLNEACSRLNAATGLKAMRGGTPDPAEVALITEDVNKWLDVLDAQLARSAFVAGDILSVADFLVLPTLEATTTVSGFVAQQPSVRAWSERLAALEGWPEPVVFPR